jgi:16S rRNA (cytidine1402-2'-O)-methyltransferase
VPDALSVGRGGSGRGDGEVLLSASRWRPISFRKGRVVSGCLVLVATPIGNLGDLSERAMETLLAASVVYCEDTRHSRTLFAARGVKTPHLVALHEHNEKAQCDEVVNRVLAGETVALISDAGTPAVSDPGQRVVAAVIAAGGRVSSVPGPSAVVAALIISGFSTERFVMEGFLPRKDGERSLVLNAWDDEQRTIVFYESPQRVGGVLSTMAQRWPHRRAAVVRELTKVHEDVLRGTLSELADQFAGSPPKGEITIVLEGAEPPPEMSVELLTERVAELLQRGLSVRDVATQLSDVHGVAHRRAYDVALALRAAMTD